MEERGQGNFKCHWGAKKDTNGKCLACKGFTLKLSSGSLRDGKVWWVWVVEGVDCEFNPSKKTIPNILINRQIL